MCLGTREGGEGDGTAEAFDDAAQRSRSTKVRRCFDGDRLSWPGRASRRLSAFGLAQASMDIWTYRETTWSTENLVGFSVEALDGGIGKIDEATNEVSASYIVVDTGPWIFGKKVMLPAGVINRVDRDEETAYVDRTKEQIKNAPEFDWMTTAATDIAAKSVRTTTAAAPAGATSSSS